MKIFKGKKRIVITLPRLGVVLKFPIIHALETLQTLLSLVGHKSERNFVKAFLKGDSSEGSITSFRGRMFGGILENWRERSLFKETKNVFLQETYFSFLGFCNIQKIAIPLEYRPSEFSKQMCILTDNEVFKDPHHFFGYSNFCIENGKLKILDYGGFHCHEVIKKYGTKLHEEFSVTK